MRKTYHPDVRATAIQLMNNGKTKGETAKILGLYPQLVERWFKSQDPAWSAEQARKLRSRRHEKAKICPKCGVRPVITPEATTCRQCYAQRGSRKEVMVGGG